MPVRTSVVIVNWNAGDALAQCLAALAADSALALLVEAHPTAGYELHNPAPVPTDPVRPTSLWWAWTGLVALAVAIWVERNHRTWLRDHPAEVAGGAR